MELQDTGERQVSPTIDGIRADHRARYEWACQYVRNRTVVDYGCGVGYGTWLLAEHAASAVGVDIDLDAILYAREHYGSTGAEFVNDDLAVPGLYHRSSVAVAFEMIEHLEWPQAFLTGLRADTLLCSVPNELVFPWTPNIAFHHRHYTPREFEELLNASGWEVQEFYGQLDHESPVEPSVNGRTLIARCVRADDPVGGRWKFLPPPPAGIQVSVAQPWVHPTGKSPETVMLCGLGPSKYELTEAMLQHDFSPPWDELWTINKGIDFLPRADVAMILDDVYDYATRHPAYGEAMRRFHGTIIGQTCLPHDGSIPFADYPLREVLAFWQAQGGSPQNWLHTISVGLIMAYAGFIGVRRLMLAGIDCSWPNRPDLSESGNAVVCYWIGRLEQLGCRVEINSDSTLNNTRNMGRYDWRPIYGLLRQPV